MEKGTPIVPIISQAPQERFLYPNGQPQSSLSLPTENQDLNVVLSNHNAQTLPNRTPSLPSEYSTLPPHPASVSDSKYETPFPDTYLRPLNNVDSVYGTPPEPAEPTNPFDANYLTLIT